MKMGVNFDAASLAGSFNIYTSERNRNYDDLSTAMDGISVF